MMKIGIGIGDIAGAPAGVDGLVAQARRAEADGFASGWFANIMGMDAIMAAALCARETRRIELGTAVMPTFPRHPHAMAQQALSAQAVAGGRFTLGVGLSHQIVIEGMLGLSFAKPYSHMKEYLAVLGPLIRSGSVSHWGSEYRVNAQLAVPGGKSCAILVAALAPKMLALTGREADGTITWMTGPKTIREHTAPRIREAAAQAGPTAPRVAVVIRCRDQTRALDFYARVLGLGEERRLEAIGLIQLRAGAGMIDLVPADPPPSHEGRNVDHVCLGVDAPDMAALIRYLRAEGVEVLGDPAERYGARGMGLSVYVLDPDGNIIELKQRPAA